MASSAPVSEAVAGAPLATSLSDPRPGARGGRRLMLRLVGTPVALAVVLLALYLWVSGQQLDSIEQRTLNYGYLSTAIEQHLELTGLATLLVVVIAIPLGILMTRRATKPLRPLVLGLANLGQATPAIGLLVLLTIQFGVGFHVAMIGLVAYAVLPVLRNTMIGIEQVDPALVEAARGMGMRPLQVLRTVELRLAVPVILAGLRTALVLSVGVATLATFVAAGGLGDIIVNGIKLDRQPVLITGSVLTCCIAFGVDWLGGVVEQVLRPRGL